MDRLDELLTDVQRTNPEMTRERLLEELEVNSYSSNSLFSIFQIFQNRFD